jgi:hypothetical protein
MVSWNVSATSASVYISRSSTLTWGTCPARIGPCRTADAAMAPACRLGPADQLAGCGGSVPGGQQQAR